MRFPEESDGSGDGQIVDHLRLDLIIAVVPGGIWVDIAILVRFILKLEWSFDDCWIVCNIQNTHLFIEGDDRRWPIEAWVYQVSTCRKKI